MKEMVYDYNIHLKGQGIILDEGDYKDHHYVIINLGTHPVAYAEVKRTPSDLFKISTDLIDVHGCVTYAGDAHWNKEDKRPYIGWDYAHCGDYYGADELVKHLIHLDFPMPEDKKWTTEEILKDVHSVIEQLVKLEA